MPQPRTSPPLVDFNAAVSLALTMDFNSAQPQHFGAPAATSQPFQVGSFEGAVVRGASCNCQRITLIPHCNGTHTESASHLTVQQRPLQEIVPAAPLRAMLVTAHPAHCADTDDDSIPAPQHSDRLITRATLDAWRDNIAGTTALLLRTGTRWDDPVPPYLSRQFMSELVAAGIEHLITDLPSVDRLQDEGRLTAHRIFFGLPERSTDLALATRAHCTITELAHFPARLVDGPCAVQLQIPALTGDAVPSRPLYLPLVQT